MRVLPVLCLLAMTLGGERGATTASPQPLDHDAYVWQRRWTEAVRGSVAAAPAVLSGLRVLALDVRGAEAAQPEVDVAALIDAARPVTAVVRIDGARLPPSLSLAAAHDRIAAWQRAGVPVVGLEIDHDCATAALPAYAAWLATARPAGLRFSITALPTWAGSPALTAVAAAVDELVVQVHAVRAPRVFDPPAARDGLRRVAAAVPGARLRVALPTYQVEVDGAVRRAEPAEVAGFVRWLERGDAPRVTGVVWFRLPVTGDRLAWNPTTLTAVIRGERLAPALVTRALPRAPGVFDLIVRNTGTVAARWPHLQVAGEIAAIDLVGGYRADADHPRRWRAPARELAAGETAVVGWATGAEITIHVD